MKKIGIFGGAFNPPHIAHKQIIEISKKELNLDLLVILPSNNPPHKKLIIPKEERKKIIELAFSKEDKIVIDYYEFNSNNINYTIDTILYLKEKYQSELYYIIGGDSMINFDKWKKPEEIIKNTNLVVIQRGNEKKEVIQKIDEYKKKLNKNIYLLNYLPKNISSSLLRFYLSTNQEEKFKNYLDKEVSSYIIENALYENYENIISDLKRDLSDERFKHSLRVAEFALKLNSVTLRLDDKKVILASLLHDVAKSQKVIEDFLNKYKNNDKIINTLCKNKIIHPVLHAFIGSYIVEERYNIKDIEILDSIRYHTTGRENMTDLEKLVFVSDMLEEKRDFDGVDKLRELIYKDFEQGFKKCIKTTYEFVSKKTKDIFYLTEKAYNYYN